MSAQHPTDEERKRLELVREPPPDHDDLAPRDFPTNNPTPEIRPTDIEATLLGTLLLHPHHAPTVKTQLTPDDFTNPHHATTWTALQEAVELVGPDPALLAGTIATELAHQYPGGRRRGLTPNYLPDLLGAAGEPLHLTQYIQTVRDKARRRVTAQAARRVAALAETGTIEDTDQALARAVDEISEAATRWENGTTTTPIHIPNIRDFLTQQPDTHDWIIPGLLEKGDRIILTGGEGSGKSTLARQFATTCAAGIHPFTHIKIPPIRVLVIDFENSENQMARAFGKLYAKVSRDMNPDNLLIYSRLSGIDLMLQEDRDWMTRIVNACKPQLLITGPHYKMTAGDTDKEKESKPVALYLDQLRADHGCAVWLEAHVGNEQPGSKNRPERPFGWSGWRRWPEFGLYLAADGQLKHWRGDRDQRDWPPVLTRSNGDWPWATTIDETETRWHDICKARDNHGGFMSIRDLATATGYDRNAISRTIGRGARHVHDWALINGQNPYTKNSTEDETW